MKIDIQDVEHAFVVDRVIALVMLYMILSYMIEIYVCLLIVIEVRIGMEL